MRFRSEGLTRMLGSQSLAMQEHAPGVLFGLGVVGMIGSTVLACRGTLKLETTLEKGQKDLAIHKAINNDEYTEQMRRKDIARIYVRTGAEVTRLYAPSIVVGTASIACLTKSHNILNDRITAITAAYAAVDKAFREYRERVVERYGEETDRQMRYGSEKVEVINPETGRKKTVDRVPPGELSQYARFFDQHSESWGKDPEINFIYLKSQQTYFNNLLQARGHVFLNEVYHELGLPHSGAGAVVGWRMTPDPEEGNNFIDFGLFRDDQSVRDFVNGREGAILLDFNVDGVIFNKIDTPPTPLSWQRG